jgi:hypothetical protein
MGRLTNLASFGVIKFVLFWIKKGLKGFLPNRSFVSKLMIQSKTRAKKENKDIFEKNKRWHSPYF